MDNKQFGHFFKQITGAYPSFEPTPERLNVWSRKMANMDFDTAMKRLDEYIGTNKYPPTIADILSIPNEWAPGEKEAFLEHLERGKKNMRLVT